MSAGIITRIDALFNRLGLSERSVYKRVYTKTGVDELTGRAGTVTTADTLLSPQPRVALAGSLTRATEDERVLQNADYALLVSPTAMDADDFQDPDVRLVLKTSNSEEELRVLTVDPIVIYGRSVLFKVYATGRKQ